MTETITRAKWIDPDFRRQSNSSTLCCVCGRSINPKRPHRLVRLLDGAWVVHSEDEAGFQLGAAVMDDGRVLEIQRDDGEAQLGMDCARRLGLEWSRAPV
jgi:hypothetical protein